MLHRFGGVATATRTPVSDFLASIADEYEPGIVENIINGKPGPTEAFCYWLMSNPERKLYMTYRLLHEYYETGILKGRSPVADIHNEALARLVRKEVGALRDEFSLELLSPQVI